MPTATLTFRLPDEAIEHLCAVHGLHLHTALNKIDEHLCSLLKNGGIKTISSAALALEVRAEICEALAMVES